MTTRLAAAPSRGSNNGRQFSPTSSSRKSDGVIKYIFWAIFAKTLPSRSSSASSAGHPVEVTVAYLSLHICLLPIGMFNHQAAGAVVFSRRTPNNVPEPHDLETMRSAMPRHFEFSTMDRLALDDLDATLAQVSRASLSALVHCIGVNWQPLCQVPELRRLWP